MTAPRPRSGTFPRSAPGPTPAIPPPPGGAELTDDEREALRRARASVREVRLGGWWARLLRLVGLR